VSVKLPKDWDEDRVRGVLKHYETQTEDAAAKEDEQRLENVGVITKLREANGEEQKWNSRASLPKHSNWRVRFEPVKIAAPVMLPA
jgi:hypothetical protein